ncbi:hypothetical protein M9Y10_010232 [Tritrichomonas musculus]|uniref:3-beta hydroxysteroid dehydrogenase/isomerase domain-containing protein n=1 Tax=Tritrichomonas musculus TaxID=1915356 RepID=A0ABR2IRI2_9EUKA
MFALNFFLINLLKNSFSMIKDSKNEANSLLLQNSGIKESSIYYNYSNVLNSTSQYTIFHNYTAKKTVFITGATGVMGQATLNEFVKHLDEFKLKLLILPNKESKRVINRYIKKYGKENIEIIWGDLLNYDDVLNGVKGSDYVLHIGGLVSPMADAYPYLTQKVNVDSAKNIVKAILAQPNKDEIKVCYIGSVAETGNRNYPIHWGRTGDPIKVSIYDHYGLSKVLAERVFVESGIRNWVVLRQSGILHPGLFKHMDPIIFTISMNNVLEWCTVEDSGRLMLNMVLYDKNNELSPDFWKRFYNIGSGENYRLTNYEFENLIFENIGLGKVDNSFQPNWFSSKNFHGHYYIDSDVLEDYLHFRENLPTIEYFQRMLTKIDFYYRIPKYLPMKRTISFFVKIFMKLIASTKTLGSIDWIRSNNTERISAFYGSLEEYNQIPKDWSHFKIEKYNTSISDGITRKLNHGYNENKPLSEIDIDDLRQAAKYRGGELISKFMRKGDLDTKLIWRCGHCGKVFKASPRLILLGGHWCPHCYIPKKSWNYDSIAKTNPFFAQVWYNDHRNNENNVYHFDELFNKQCYLNDRFHPFRQFKETQSWLVSIIKLFLRQYSHCFVF